MDVVPTGPRLILVTKFKGGVGATHVAALLAHGLAEQDPTVFADLEPQGDGAQILAVPLRREQVGIREFLHRAGSVEEALCEIPTSRHGYYLAPVPECNRPTGQGLYWPDRLRAAGAEARLRWVVIDAPKLPDPRTAVLVAGVDVVVHVVANAFGVRTVARMHDQLVRHATVGVVHTVLNRQRKDPSEHAVLDQLAADPDRAARFGVCPVRVRHDGWVAYATRYARSPFAVGNAKLTHEAAAELAEWVRGIGHA